MAQQNAAKSVWVTPQMKTLGSVVEMTQDKTIGSPDDELYMKLVDGLPDITGSI